jgi:transcriptional regulator with XRE-family HTH domain
VWTKTGAPPILARMARVRSGAPRARDIFAANMKRLRIEKGLSQEKLAALAALHPNYIGSVERRERNISIDNISKIAAALGVPASALFVTTDGKGR